MAVTTSTNKSCAVIGVGALGTLLCKQILSSPQLHGKIDSVTGITKSRSRHDSIIAQIGSSTKLKLITEQEFKELQPRPKFAYVVFCAPPSGFADYPAAVKEAVEDYWAGPESNGVFVFTSSGAVYGDSTATVSESTPVTIPEDNPRIARLVSAEKECLKAGGCCLRLAGLYDLTRGPHNIWITSGKVIQSSPHGLINLLHYEDAASACLAVLQTLPANASGKIYLISDGHPLSRYDICENAKKANIYQKYSMPDFEKHEEQEAGRGHGKIYDTTNSMKELNWMPKYRSFAEFMASNA